MYSNSPPGSLSEEEMKVRRSLGQVYRVEQVSGYLTVHLRYEKGSQEYDCMYSLMQVAEISSANPYFDSEGEQVLDIPTKAAWVLRSFSTQYLPGYVPEVSSSPYAPSHAGLASKMRDMIPGIAEVVKVPCMCTDYSDTRQIWSLIQHLNDVHHPKVPGISEENIWTRERIADWLDTLDADLVLDPDRKPAPRPKQPPAAGKFTVDMNVNMDAILDVIQVSKEAIDKLVGTFNTFSETLKTAQQQEQLHQQQMLAAMQQAGITPEMLKDELGWHATAPESKEHDKMSCVVCKAKNNQEES